MNILKTFILNSSTSLSSAISNDLSYIESISLPLSLFANRQDLLILVSSSGKSPNILNAHNKAKELGIEVITLSGFGCSSQILDCEPPLPAKKIHAPLEYLFSIRFIASPKCFDSYTDK